MEAIHILTLQQIKGVGRKTIQRLLDAIDSEVDSTESLHDQLAHVEDKVSRFRAPDLNSLRSAFQQSIRIIEEARNKNIHVLSYRDKAFPPRLRKIPDPPVLVFVQGDLSSVRREEAVAVIGTRNPTDLGAKVAERLGRILAEREIAVVSGLAYGCDIAAHKGCIKETGIGIAVLAHGLDTMYPAAHRGEAEQLIEHGGALITEYPPGFKPNKRSFVERDRLQSGLSRGVIVIETGVKGGTMHTVGFAEKQGRKVACFSNNDRNYHNHTSVRGNRRLLESGRALPIGSPEDIDRFLSAIEISGQVVSNQEEHYSFGKQRPEPSSTSKLDTLSSKHSLSDAQTRMVKKLITDGPIQHNSLTGHEPRTANALKRKGVVDEEDGVITLSQNVPDNDENLNMQNARMNKNGQLLLI